MNNEIKTICDFISFEGIDDIIDSWAEKSGFAESFLPKQLSSDDVTYCFSFDDDASKTLLTINILDNEVHIEAWAIENIKTNIIALNALNQLLKNLGQDGIAGG